MARMGGVLDDVEKFVTDTVLPIAEKVVPLVAPQAAPIVAAEHALRTGKPLDYDSAKAATTAATDLGKQVAATQGVSSTVQAEQSEPPELKAARVDMETAKRQRDRAEASKTTTYLLIAAGIGLLLLLE
jgi:hypothetical protein